MAYTKYPNQIDSSTELPIAVDKKTQVIAEVVNRLRDAILAVESELGINPSREYGTVRARLDAIMNIIASGPVFGPVSSTDNAVARFDGVIGTRLQNSLVIVNDAGDITTSGTALTLGDVSTITAKTSLVLQETDSPTSLTLTLGIIEPSAGANILWPATVSSERNLGITVRNDAAGQDFRIYGQGTTFVGASGGNLILHAGAPGAGGANGCVIIRDPTNTGEVFKATGLDAACFGRDGNAFTLTLGQTGAGGAVTHLLNCAPGDSLRIDAPAGVSILDPCIVLSVGGGSQAWVAPWWLQVSNALRVANSDSVEAHMPTTGAIRLAGSNPSIVARESGWAADAPLLGYDTVAETVTLGDASHVRAVSIHATEVLELAEANKGTGLTLGDGVAYATLTSATTGLRWADGSASAHTVGIVGSTTTDGVDLELRGQSTTHAGDGGGSVIVEGGGGGAGGAGGRVKLRFGGFDSLSIVDADTCYLGRDAAAYTLQFGQTGGGAAVTHSVATAAGDNLGIVAGAGGWVHIGPGGTTPGVSATGVLTTPGTTYIGAGAWGVVIGASTHYSYLPFTVKSSASALPLSGDNFMFGLDHAATPLAGVTTVFRCGNLSNAASSPNNLLIRAGNSGTYGGSLYLQPGSGVTGDDGYLELQDSSGLAVISITPDSKSQFHSNMVMTGDYEFLPYLDDIGSIGAAGRRFSLVRAKTITSGDIGFDDEACPLCDQPFKEGEELVLKVMRREFDDRNGQTVCYTVPTHLNCAHSH